MENTVLRFLARPGFTLAVAVLLMASPGYLMAQQSRPLIQQQVSQFLANPSSALAANPNGGGRLVSLIRDLLLSDRDTLPVIIALLTNATADQQSAIGSALGQAAQALASTDPNFANQIQSGLAQSGSSLAIASYQSTTGNVQIGAAGGAGAGGGGGGPVIGEARGGGGGGGAGIVSAGTGTGSTSVGLTGGSVNGAALTRNVSPN
jgi:hypothetical protein